MAELAGLEDLTLRSITVAGLDFLRKLKHLWSLDIKLGGTSNLNALEGMTGIKYLELWHVKDMRNIDFVSTLSSLQLLFLQCLPHIKALPDMSRLAALRRVHLESMKGLKDISALSAAPCLEELVHIAAIGMEPAKYADLLKHKSLKRLSVGFGSRKKNEMLRELAESAGIRRWTGASLSSSSRQVRWHWERRISSKEELRLTPH